ncbi:hypothetical protein Tco_1085131 [Tanacetum coccineum]
MLPPSSSSSSHHHRYPPTPPHRLPATIKGCGWQPHTMRVRMAAPQTRVHDIKEGAGWLTATTTMVRLAVTTNKGCVGFHVHTKGPWCVGLSESPTRMRLAETENVRVCLAVGQPKDVFGFR